MYSTHQRRRERASIVEWVANDNYTHAITLNTDRELSLTRFKDICSTFCHELDRKVWGKRNMRRCPIELRMRGIFFPENLATNAHLHGGVDLSAAMRVFGNDWRMAQEIRRAWLTATKGAGSVDIKLNPDAGWFAYCTKRSDGTYFLAADFHPL